MADPLTVLGAAAAAAQLAEQAYSLLKFFSALYGKIMEAPELIQARVSHIEQLQSVSKLIENTKPLQTSEVQAVLVACLQTTLDLNKILEQCSLRGKDFLRRALQSAKVVHKEDKIVILLDRIEKQKSLLALCIHQLDAAQLETLNIEILEVRTSLGNTAIVINDTAAHVQTLVNITPAMADQVKELFTNVPGLLGRIQEDLKKIASSAHLHPNVQPLSESEKEISGKTKPEFVTVKNVLMTRVFLWSSMILAIFVFICCTFFGQKDLGNETSLRSYDFYEVPSQRVKNFVGREETLARIKTGFSASSDYGPIVVVIRAMGGQGKTQVALKYCQLWKNASDIFWIDATSESTLKADFALLSYVLDNSTSPALEIEARVSKVRRALTSRETPWLIVLDNYDDPQSYNLKQFIPDNTLGMVIITSRHRDAEALADPKNRIELTGLNENEAIELLLLESELNNSVNIFTEHAATIVHRLAYHPLAIAQAGAYIRMRRLDLDEFMDIYNERQAAILKETTPLMSTYWKRVNESSREIPMSVFTTSELSYQQLLDLENVEPRNLPDLLTMLAFFESSDVPEALLKTFSQPLDLEYCHIQPEFLDWIEETRRTSKITVRPCDLTNSSEVYEFYGQSVTAHEEDLELLVLNSRAELTIPEPASALLFKGPGSFLRHQGRKWDSTSFLEALLVLQGLSLVELSSPSSKRRSIRVSLHPLIRDWLRLRTPTDQCLKYSSSAATCIFKFLALMGVHATDQVTLSDKQQLVRHINAYAANLAEFSANQPAEDFEIPIYGWGVNKGRPAYEFSKFLYQNGQYEASKEWASQSLAQRLQHFGSESRETLQSQASLAAALDSLGDYGQARQIYTHIIKVKEWTLGPEHPETLLSKVNLAPLLTNEGEYDAAEIIYRSALESYISNLGERDPNTIIVMGALGSLLNLIEESNALMDIDNTYQANYTEAEQLNRRALDLATLVFGESHHRTLAVMDFLGVSLTGVGEFEEAEVILQGAFRLRERESGREHPDTIMCASHLITVLDRLGKFAEAVDIQVRIFEREGEVNVPFRRDHVFGLY